MDFLIHVVSPKVEKHQLKAILLHKGLSTKGENPDSVGQIICSHFSFLLLIFPTEVRRQMLYSDCHVVYGRLLIKSFVGRPVLC